MLQQSIWYKICLKKKTLFRWGLLGLWTLSIIRYSKEQHFRWCNGVLVFVHEDIQASSCSTNKSMENLITGRHMYNAFSIEPG
jgi:hypothetical protein